MKRGGENGDDQVPTLQFMKEKLRSREGEPHPQSHTADPGQAQDYHPSVLVQPHDGRGGWGGRCGGASRGGRCDSRPWGTHTLENKTT